MSALAPPSAPRGLTEAALWIVIVLGGAAILSLGREILAPLVFSILLSFALSPIVRAVQKVGAPRAVGATVALGVFAAAFGIWVWFASGQLSDLIAKLPAYQANIQTKAHGLADRIAALGGGKGQGLASAFENIAHMIGASSAKSAGAPQPVEVVNESPFSQLSVLGSFASPVLSPLAQAIVVLVFTIFLLVEQEDLRNRIIKLIGPKDIYRTTEAIDDGGRRIGRMLFAQVTMNGAYGIVVALALWAIGVPNPALWGSIAGLSRFVPYIGVLFGVVPPLLVAFAFAPGWTEFALTLGLFAFLEFVTGQVVEPVVYGHSSGLSPTAVVVAATVWAFLWGPLGLVLATPVTTVIVVLGRHVPGLAFLETLLGDEPPLTPQETFYQRMLAGDPREASRHARDYVRRGAIAAYYDEVALDALRHARVDVARGDLDDGRLNALTHSTAELIASLGGAPRRAWLPGWLWLWRGRLAVEARREDMLREHMGEVAVLHGDHPLDPLGAAMLAHAMSRRGLPSRIVSREEALTANAAQLAAVSLIALCYIEPLTLAQLRAAAAKARWRCPQAKIVVCVWRDPGDDTLKSLERRLRCDAIATGITSACAQALRLLGRGGAPWTLLTASALEPPKAKAA